MQIKIFYAVALVALFLTSCSEDETSLAVPIETVEDLSDQEPERGPVMYWKHDGKDWVIDEERTKYERLATEYLETKDQTILDQITAMMPSIEETQAQMEANYKKDGEGNWKVGQKDHSRGFVYSANFYPSDPFKQYKLDYRVGNNYYSLHSGTVWLTGSTWIALTFPQHCFAVPKRHIRATASFLGTSCANLRIRAYNYNAPCCVCQDPVPPSGIIDEDNIDFVGGLGHGVNFRANESAGTCENEQFIEPGADCYTGSNPSC